MNPRTSDPSSSSPHSIRCGKQSLDLTTPSLMAVLNVTPDSFSDGGRWLANNKPAVEKLTAEALRMCEAGAKILDVGGESTRPGASPVSLQQELDRVIPTVEALVEASDAIVSVDTSSPEVMREAARVGAGLINDVRALQRDGAMDVARECGLPVCLMHMQGSPKSMQEMPTYSHPVKDVADFLTKRVQACVQAGLARDQIVVDPGFGFGKTLEHNLALLNGLGSLCSLGFPVLVGVSRKSMIGAITGKPTGQRLSGSLTLGLLALQNGASILRVHDVEETADMLKIFQAAKDAEAV
ncbi:MAG: dihydropteroate synthase [Pseudomonadota bacterium]